ncbi:tRNA dihydrouridine synthase DusB [Candidatus Woesearchaeota archaeon]|nr:tRNA dihydrouridine synthase DusB [Candidatus Woesearchaeota archaeon]
MTRLKDVRIAKLRLNNPLCLAPLLGVNCIAFRLMCHDYGAALVFSPMIHSAGLVKADDAGRASMLEFVKEERPLAIQLIGRDPQVMVESLQYIEPFCDTVDLNFGCPDKDILGQKMGAYFSKHPEQMTRVISAVAGATDKPVTAKIRIGWDSQSLNHVAAAKIVEDAGAAAVVVHGRTTKQGYSGRANWTAIRQVKEKVNIPVIGNGDIWSADDAKRMLDTTKCDMAMAGRGAMGNPYLFRQCVSLIMEGKALPDQTTEQKREMLLEFIRLYGKVQPVKRFTELRQHAMWFCTGAKGAASKRLEISRAGSKEELVRIVKKEFSLKG